MLNVHPLEAYSEESHVKAEVEKVGVQYHNRFTFPTKWFKKEYGEELGKLGARIPNSDYDIPEATHREFPQTPFYHV